MSSKKYGVWLVAISVVFLISMGVLLLSDGKPSPEGKRDHNKNTDAAVFDKDQTQECWLETVIIKDCVTKDGPGDSYNTVGNLK